MQEQAQKIDRFVCRFDESYRLLVYHAAIPSILTPELLNYLRHQFLRGRVLWVAEVDLLLSDLFKPVGDELYAMESAVRAYLLENIEDFFRAQGFGEKHLQEVALILLGYIKYLARTHAFLSAPELQAQQWAAMVCLEDKKERVFQEIKEAFQACGSEAELARLTKITEELSPQLRDYPSLIEFAGAVRDLLRDLRGDFVGNRERVIQLGQTLDLSLDWFPGLTIKNLGIRRILLIEDELDTIQEIAADLRSQYDIEVIGTDEVNEVIELSQEGQIDLILMNYDLPNSYYRGKRINGIEIVRLLKANPKVSSELPIVGFSIEEYRREEFLQEADGFYSKLEVLEGGDYPKFVRYLQEVYQRVTQSRSARPGKHYAIAIGINRYKNWPSLQYSVRDAEAMRDWFRLEGGFKEVYLFTDNSPPIIDAVGSFSSKPVYRHLMKFLQVKFEKPFCSAGDDLWFFFSGHGLQDRDLDYLMLADSDPHHEAIQKTALSVNYLKEQLRLSGAGNVFMFLDASRDLISR